ncbi:MAG: SDR family oxidoreductase [Eubacteriales bacterium]
MYDLNNKICVIAGSSSGIGKETALQFSRSGATVICAARRQENLIELVTEIESEGGQAEAIPCDFKDPSSVEHIASYVKEKYGRIDVWVNGVGVNNAMGVTWDLSYDEWFADVDGNLRTCYLGTKCAINVMKDQGFGRIINMSGGGVIRPEIYNSAYACSKTALVRFTECIALELQKENIPIKIFAFNPGLVRTERTADLVNLEATKKFMPGIIDKIKNDDATPIHIPAQFMAFIATGAVDKLDGCLIITEMDKDYLIAHADEIVANKSYKIHVRDLQ